MGKGDQMDAIYLDVSKAFDSVDVNLLCHKLHLMGMNEQLLKWIIEYLNGGKQFVKLSSSIISSEINVTSGVGQGYPIGATLFILFLIDLPLYIENASLYLFDDDAKLLHKIATKSDCEKLQKDLEKANNFFEINKLKLNVNKTKAITYHKKKKHNSKCICILFKWINNWKSETNQGFGSLSR